MEVPPQLVRGVLGSDRGAICGDDGTGYVAGAGRGEKRDGLAVSPGLAARPVRVVAPTASVRSGAGPPEFTGPGGTAFTRTPLGLNSAAHARVIQVRLVFLAP